MTILRKTFNQFNFYSESLFTLVLFHLLSTVITQMIMFWFHFKLNVLSLLIPFLIWLYLDKVLYGQKDRAKRVITNVLTYVIVWFLFLRYFSMFIEFSFDGNFYHGDTMIQLVYGWNPVYLTDLYFKSNGSIWGELYPKFSWIIGGLFIKLTSMSSAGMILNGLMGVLVFIKTYAFMKKRSSKRFAFVIALIVLLNPIFIEQFHTLYIDGIIAHLVALLIITNLELIEDYNLKSLFHLVMISVILINLKFTSFAFAGLIDLSAFIFYIVKDRKIALRIVYAGILILMVALFIGYSPYIVNLLNGRNIFWPLAGANNWITGDDQVIEAMIKLTSIQRFFYSLTYGEFFNSLVDFTSKGYLFYDQRIGAMGIHFAKYLFLASFFLVAYAIKDRKKLNWPYILMFILFTASIVFNYKMVWKLRYIPHFWLMVPLTVILSNHLFKTKVISILLIVLFLHQASDMIYNNYGHNFWATKLYRDIYEQYNDGTSYKVRIGDNDMFVVMEEYKLKEHGVNIGEIVFESLPTEECHRVDMYTICFTK